MISSDRPLEYRFAVSKKLTPRSIARFTIGLALSISTIHSSVLPKDMVPKQIRETCRPVEPSCVYCIAIDEDSVIAIAFKRSMKSYNSTLQWRFGLSEQILRHT